MTKSLAFKSFGWLNGTVGDGSGGYSQRVSIRVLWEPRDLWVGLYWDGTKDDWRVYVCVVPCFPIRFHVHRSFGGIFPEAVKRYN
jgi:hypothetical protein